MRVGHGFDAHPFADGRPLVLGGVTIGGARGLRGHSDADVLCHAVCDALLGAAGLGDLGAHFPDSDPAYAGASSVELLRTVGGRVRGSGFAIASVDSTVLLEEPKLAPHIERMRHNIAEALELHDVGVVSVKATRLEGMGFVGRGEGAAAMAVALLVETGHTGRRFRRRHQP
jgi:2-C-methyl-D-erythritol 2,4-cyclodiphosphate synthase